MTSPRVFGYAVVGACLVVLACRQPNRKPLVEPAATVCADSLPFRNYSKVPAEQACGLLRAAIDAVMARPSTDPFFAGVKLEEITHARLGDMGEVDSLGSKVRDWLAISLHLPGRQADVSVEFDLNYRLELVRPLPQEGDLFDVWDEWARLRKDRHDSLVRP